MKKRTKKTECTTMYGTMCCETLESGLHLLDFIADDHEEVQPFSALCKVQAMRDGCIYITEKARRVRSKALFRDDNCSLTLGRDGRYYFFFAMEQERGADVPDELMRQAVTLANKLKSKLNK